MATYVPAQGDLVVLSDPQAGHEQMGGSPGIVVSVDAFNRGTRLAICYPVTNTESATPFHVALPNDSGLPGFVMCEQMKSIDYRATGVKGIGSAGKEFLDEVLAVIDACIYPKPDQDRVGNPHPLRAGSFMIVQTSIPIRTRALLLEASALKRFPKKISIRH